MTASGNTEDAELRGFAHGLFGDPTPDPGERPTTEAHDDLRDFAARLFDTTDH